MIAYRLNVLSVTASLLALSVYMPAQAQAVDLRIHIPEKSKMRLYSPDEYTSLTSFSGQATLNGAIVAQSKKEAVDDGLEWRTSLVLLPSNLDQGVLPTVVEGDEMGGKGADVIELNEPDVAKAIGEIFGQDVASMLEKEEFQVVKQGEVTISGYRTGIDCDRRYHYAKFEKLVNASDLKAEQAASVISKLPQSCS